jgi:hypothetical protein
MFSFREKQAISDAVQKILRETNHPELPEGEIGFTLQVHGAESWSWANIKNNGTTEEFQINAHNERQDPQTGRKALVAEQRAKRDGEDDG